MTSTRARVGGFALALAAAFGAAVGVGSLVGPVGASAQDDAPSASAEDGPAMEGHEMTESADDPTDPASAGDGASDHGEAEDEATGRDADHGSHGADGAATADVAGGLMVSERGYTLALASPTLAAGEDVPVRFEILGPDGHAVTAYDETHDKLLHLIAVRRDLTGFQHVHPELGADGTWSVPISTTPGAWRVFADFRPTGEETGLTLGADVLVAGDSQPAPLPAVAATAEVDGYQVTLTGELHSGEESQLTLTVARGGRPVTDLEPYLAAYGHLVALRAGDLAYLHVHPMGEPGDGVTPAGPGITFAATAPSPGDYRLFLDFQHGGTVRTAAFTVHVEQEHEGHTP